MLIIGPQQTRHTYMLVDVWQTLRIQVAIAHEAGGPRNQAG